MARKNEAFEALHVLLAVMEPPRSQKASVAYTKAWRVIRRKQEADEAKRKAAKR